VFPILCVHDTQIPWGEVYVDNVPVLTRAKLLALLRSLPAHMDDVRVMLLAEHARRQLDPQPEPGILPGHSPGRQGALTPISTNCRRVGPWARAREPCTRAVPAGSAVPTPHQTQATGVVMILADPGAARPEPMARAR
jgi:hypothetical protein